MEIVTDNSKVNIEAVERIARLESENAGLKQTIEQYKRVIAKLGGATEHAKIKMLSISLIPEEKLVDKHCRVYQSTKSTV